MKFGPADIIVLKVTDPEFAANPHFSDTMLRELAKAVATGAIRVLDAMVLAKAADNSVQGTDIEDLSAEVKSGLGFIETGTSGLFHSDDAEAFADDLETGGSIVVLAIEHTWATQLKDSFAEFGAVKIREMRVSEDSVNARFAEMKS